MPKRKPYIAPTILYWDFDSNRVVGNDTDKLNEVEEIVCPEQAPKVDEYIFQLQCPLDGETYSIQKDER